MKKTKIIGITIISLLWVFCLLIIFSISITLYVMYKMESSKRDIKTDVVTVVNKIQHVQLSTVEGKTYDEFTQYMVQFADGESYLVNIPGINYYKKGTALEISYWRTPIIDTVEIIDFNADTDSDPTIFDSDY